MKKLCISKKRNFKFWKDINIITAEKTFVKENCGSRSCRNHLRSLLLAEGLAVSALICGGVHLVGAHQDFVQGTVVLVAAVMGALLDSTLDALVCVTVHHKSLL